MIPNTVFQKLFENAADGFLVVDTLGTLKYANDRAKKLLALVDGPTLCALPNRVFEKLGPCFVQGLSTGTDGPSNDSPVVWQVQIADADEHPVWFQCRLQWMELENQRLCCVQLSDIDAIKHGEEHWRKLAHTDHVSELSNRRHFQSQLDLSCQDVRCIGIIDIDHLKFINDEFGHLVGDDAIHFVAERLRESFSDAHCIARLGGEEFGVLLTVDRCRQAEEAFESFRSAVEQGRFARADLNLTVSVGIAWTKPGECAMPELMHRADQALYEAKRSGRNQVRIFS